MLLDGVAIAVVVARSVISAQRYFRRGEGRPRCAGVVLLRVIQILPKAYVAELRRWYLYDLMGVSESDAARPAGTLLV